VKGECRRAKRERVKLDHPGSNDVRGTNLKKLGPESNERVPGGETNTKKPQALEVGRRGGCLGGDTQTECPTGILRERGKASVTACKTVKSSDVQGTVCSGASASRDLRSLPGGRRGHSKMGSTGKKKNSGKKPRKVESGAGTGKMRTI